MQIYQPLDLLPLWLVYILTVVVFLLATEAGFRLGKVVHKRWPDNSEAGVGAMVGASLALLGFLLAFITSTAFGLFNDRRHLVINEANAIGTTYLRAGYLTQPFRDESRQLLREYVNLRLEALDPNKTDAAITQSEKIHDELWIRAEEEARKNPGPITSLYITSLNEVIDLHSERLSAELGFRIPPVVILSLYAVSVLTLVLVGLHSSYREKHNLLAILIVVLILAIVFLLIIDLDRSNKGFIRIPQQTLIELQSKLNLKP